MYAARYPKDVDGMILSDHAGHYRFAPPPPSPFGATPVVRSQEQSLEKLPPAAQALHRWAAALPHESSIPLFDRCIAQLDTSTAARRPGAFGNRPLIVLGNASLAASDDYRKVQSELLALSRSGTSMTAATYGHDTPLDISLVRAIKRSTISGNVNSRKGRSG
jgi:pimeloyl-ACP methyl ester carboxylesterase